MNIFRIREVEEVARMLLFGMAALAAVFLICEFILRPLWHLILIR